jgi:hypothetical protein
MTGLNLKDSDMLAGHLGSFSKASIYLWRPIFVAIVNWAPDQFQSRFVLNDFCGGKICV